MAEFVQLRLEDSLPELELMEKLKLFEKHEIRAISAQRKDLEFKIQKRTKCKDDYLRYIQYEMDLLKLIRLKREKMGINLKKNEFDVAIANRINKIFHHALLRFQEDVKLWLSFVKFCKQERMFSSVSRVLERMVRIHSDKISMWKLAANWEYEECCSISKARQFLLQGLRYHPDSAMLYLEAIRLELMNAASLRKKEEALGHSSSGTSDSSSQSPSKSTTQQGQTPSSQGAQSATVAGMSQDESMDKVIDGKLAEVIYETALKKIFDVEFSISVLTIATSFDFTVRLQDRIVSDLLDRFPTNELAWDIMARRELENHGNTCPEGTQPIVLRGSDPNVPLVFPKVTSHAKLPPSNKKPTKEQISLCCEVYDAAVKQLKTDRMWNMYVEILFELNQDMSYLPKFKRNLLLQVLQGAHSANCLPEKFYFQWVEMLQSMDRGKKVATVLRAATERLSHSVELWTIRLRYYLKQGDDRQGQLVFEQALEKLGDTEECLSLWKIMIHYYQIRCPNKVELIFRESLLRSPEICRVLKPMYIEWIMITKGVAAARRAYDEIAILPPPCLEMHMKMAQLECLQPELNVKQARKCFELACDQFGEKYADVWMAYARFEAKNGTPLSMTTLHSKAMSVLEPSQADIFISEYSLLKTSME